MRTRDWATVDFYAVLGVPPTASADEVGVAFRALAKQLHPDGGGVSDADADRFVAVSAAYEVLGDDRLRRSYDQVRISVLPPAPAAAVDPVRVAEPTRRSARVVAPEIARRNGRRWLGAGIAVFVIGLLVATLVVNLQIRDARRRAGRVKVHATLVIAGARHEVRFRTSSGETVEVPEPTRVNPGTGTEHNGQSITVLYRTADPRDVILDESTIARNITLWIVALKMLVGGAVFFAVGVRRLRRVPRPGTRLLE